VTIKNKFAFLVIKTNTWFDLINFV